MDFYSSHREKGMGKNAGRPPHPRLSADRNAPITPIRVIFPLPRKLNLVLSFCTKFISQVGELIFLITSPPKFFSLPCVLTRLVRGQVGRVSNSLGGTLNAWGRSWSLDGLRACVCPGSNLGHF